MNDSEVWLKSFWGLWRWKNHHYHHCCYYNLWMMFQFLLDLLDRLPKGKPGWQCGFSGDFQQMFICVIGQESRWQVLVASLQETIWTVSAPQLSRFLCCLMFLKAANTTFSTWIAAAFSFTFCCDSSSDTFWIKSIEKNQQQTSFQCVNIEKKPDCFVFGLGKSLMNECKFTSWHHPRRKEPAGTLVLIGSCVQNSRLSQTWRCFAV